MHARFHRDVFTEYEQVGIITTWFDVYTSIMHVTHPPPPQGTRASEAISTLLRWPESKVLVASPVSSLQLPSLLTADFRPESLFLFPRGARSCALAGISTDNCLWKGTRTVHLCTTPDMLSELTRKTYPLLAFARDDSELDSWLRHGLQAQEKFSCVNFARLALPATLDVIHQALFEGDPYGRCARFPAEHALLEIATFSFEPGWQVSLRVAVKPLLGTLLGSPVVFDAIWKTNRSQGDVWSSFSDGKDLAATVRQATVYESNEHCTPAGAPVQYCICDFGGLERPPEQEKTG
ncbi:unnamed protein product [Polarella glacialis]|uniref:Uncharacterized protein n=1 Tax=Polarella glacialis TaxID=89957 RepID=A0A813GUA5_POLGL|nr:unnamed protein product [Polarella glacialis]